MSAGDFAAAARGKYSGRGGGGGGFAGLRMGSSRGGASSIVGGAEDSWLKERRREMKVMAARARIRGMKTKRDRRESVVMAMDRQ